MGSNPGRAIPKALKMVPVAISCLALSIIRPALALLSLTTNTTNIAQKLTTKKGPPGVLGIWGEGLFIFREPGSIANYFRGAGEHAHTFGDLGSTAKK